MENKYICSHCGEDLKEVGVYRKIYNNYAYSEHAQKFVLSSEDDDEGNMCSNCDSYVEIVLPR